MRRILTVVAAAALLTGCGGKDEGSGGTGAGGTKPTLRFSAIPDQNATLLRQKFEPVARYLSEQLGVPVEYVHATDYQASVEKFRNGEIQLAWFGGLTGVQARHKVPGAHAIVQGQEDPTFYSYFIANASTGLERGDDFPMGAAGMTFSFGSESSTSGRLMPEHFIREATGQAPDEFFATVGFSGDHDKTVELVASGAVQVGVVNYTVYDRRIEKGQTDPEVCRIIWKTPEFADYNFTAHPDLETMFGAGFTAKLQKALVDMKDPELLSAFPRKGLIPAKDEEFEGIRQVAEALGFLD